MGFKDISGTKDSMEIGRGTCSIFRLRASPLLLLLFYLVCAGFELSWDWDRLIFIYLISIHRQIEHKLQCN